MNESLEKTSLNFCIEWLRSLFWRTCLAEGSQYQKSGVDVEAGDALVDWLQKKDQQKQIFSERLISGIGGFASIFNCQFPEIKKPCLVTCTDGVGTKVKIAARHSRLEGIGQDLVAMCVNDLICTGGKPLLFLDYYAVGKLHLPRAQSFLESVKKACAESEMALVGGETAEMPGVYQDPDFDCAGFAVGIVDQDSHLGPHRVKAGDILLGVASSGFHSNGYSLLRKVFEKDEEEHLEELLKPTRLYPALMKELLSTPEIEVKAAAHITGGGLDNLPRILPANTQAQLQTWEWPRCFREVQKRTAMTELEMLKTLNCGLGFVVVVSSGHEEKALEKMRALGYESWRLGEVTESENEEPTWRFRNGVGL